MATFTTYKMTCIKSVDWLLWF